MKKDAQRVAIAGAGIAGLTTALLLARYGFTVEVFEKAPALSEVGAGIQISPNAARVLSALDLDTALDETAVRPAEVTMRSGRDNAVIARVPLGARLQARHGAPYRVIHRADLQAVLLTAVRASPAIALHLDSPIQEAYVESDHVILHTATGDVFRAHVLIGADGVWSALRGRIGASTAQATGQTAWRTLVPTDSREAATQVDLWLARDAHVVSYPVSAGRLTNIVAVTADRRTDIDTEAPTTLPAAPFEGLCADLRSLLARAEGWTRWPLYGASPETSWSKGRIALIGDAAHAMLPFVAQGGAMAIEDAAELAAALATNGADPAALALYERRRKPRVIPIWREARRLAWVYHLPRPASLARDATLRALGSDRLLARMDAIYGWRPSALPT